MGRNIVKPIIDREFWITADQMEVLNLTEIKLHLKVKCEFSDTDIKAFFALFEKDKRAICKIFGVLSIPASWFKEDDWEKNSTIMLEALSQATKVGPRSEPVFFQLSKLSNG